MRLQSKLTAFHSKGFTLIELIVVITIVAILAATANKFIANPTQSYFDLETRANLTDRADSTIRQMAREVRNALPNSVRVTNGTDHFIEFLPIKDAGRYRASKGAAGHDELDFTLAADSFEVYGGSISVATGDALVIYNLGDTGSNAYAGDNVRTVTGGGNSLSFSGGQFPFASPSSRFYIINTAVTYACDMSTDPSNKKLWMYSNYAIQSSQPTSISTLDGLSNVRKSLLAEQLSSCSFSYNTGFSQRAGIVNLTLALTQDTANARLIHQVSISNTP